MKASEQFKKLEQGLGKNGLEFYIGPAGAECLRKAFAEKPVAKPAAKPAVKKTTEK